MGEYAKLKENVRMNSEIDDQDRHHHDHDQNDYDDDVLDDGDINQHEDPPEDLVHFGVEDDEENDEEDDLVAEIPSEQGTEYSQFTADANACSSVTSSSEKDRVQTLQSTAADDGFEAEEESDRTGSS